MIKREQSEPAVDADERQADQPVLRSCLAPRSLRPLRLSAGRHRGEGRSGRSR